MVQAQNSDHLLSEAARERAGERASVIARKWSGRGLHLRVVWQPLGDHASGQGIWGDHMLVDNLQVGRLTALIGNGKGDRMIPGGLVQQSFSGDISCE